MHIFYQTVGIIMAWRHAPRDERGLSQSTENALLLAGAAAIALMIVVFISNYVSERLPTETF